MTDQPSASCRGPAQLVPLSAVVVVIAAVTACAVYANLSFLVKEPTHYRFFPSFRPYFNENRNHELGGENFEISRSIVAGQGFASPFREPSGPTAWMPPVLPLLQAGLLWACDGNREAVMAVVIVLHAAALIVTGILVLTLVGQTTGPSGYLPAIALFVLGLICHFQWWFQRTHDSFLVLLALQLLIAGACWWRPLDRWRSAAGWGLLGGIGALISPILVFIWFLQSLVIAGRGRAWGQLAVALFVAGLVLTPWTVRNWLVFGRLIPVKSNLAFELYQSQCLQPDGLAQRPTFALHPYQSAGRERLEHRTLGEIAFLDRKMECFRQAVAANPLDFVKRMGDRLLGATLWYVPFDRPEEAKRPWLLWSYRAIFALPALGLLVLVLTSAWRPLSSPQWIVIGVYLLYLLPYVVVSYYERYAVPLFGIKVLLVIWGADRALWLLSSLSPRLT